MEMLDNPIITEIERYGELDNDEPILHCDCCGEGIYEGDEFWDIKGEIHCRDCIEEMKELA